MSREEMKGRLVRDENGQFVAKHKNLGGRPKGSKNKITLQKLMVEEKFRGGSAPEVLEVLDMIVRQALEGDRVSQKLVWDASVSKQNISEEKNAGARQEIKVHTMNVNRGIDIEGEFEVATTEEETIQ